MKRLLILGIVAQMVVGTAHAQYEKAVRVSSDTTRTAIIQEVSKGLSAEAVSGIGSERDKQGWFVEASAGGGFYAAELNRTANNFLSRMHPAFQIGFGKWVAPMWAIRVAAGYTQFKGDYYLFGEWNMFDQADHSTAPAEAKADCYTDEAGNYWFKRKFNVADFQVDLMYDVNRLFTKRSTPFDIIAYAGVGYSYAFKSQGVSWNGSLNFKAGLDVNFNLSRTFYLKAGVEGTIVDESLDGQINGYSGGTNRTVEGYAQAHLGIGINLNPRKPRVHTYTVPYTVNVSKDYITRENVVKEDFRAPFVVRFYIDQYNVEPDQELNIAKVCKYLQEHPDARLLMTGHADPETANPTYNQALSERRCNSVLKYIDEHYGIDHSRIDVKPMGDTNGKFKEDFRWNRCVILYILDK